MTVGLGGAARADFVALTWSDGVFQTELGLDGGELHLIAETQRQLSSCPVLFAWDGSRFRFVTDVLGVGGIGFFEQPGTYSEPLPRENVLPARRLARRPGRRYRLKIAEPMEEVTYLDAVSLVAYDLPPGWRMALDERKAVNGPAPTGAPIFYREERRPAAARDESGADVTARLQQADLSAVGPRQLRLALHRACGAFRRGDHFRRSPSTAGPAARPARRRLGGVSVRADDVRGVAGGRGLSRRRQSRHATVRAAGTKSRASSGIPPACRGRWLSRCRRFPPARRRSGFGPRRRSTGTASLSSIRSRCPAFAARCCPCDRRRSSPSASPDAARDRSARQATTTSGAHRSAIHGIQRGWYTEFGEVDPLVADEDSAVAIFGPGEALDVAFEAPQTTGAGGLDPRVRARVARLVQGHGPLHPRWGDDRAASGDGHRRHGGCCTRASIRGTRQGTDKRCESGDLDAGDQSESVI